jgi:hypothetical protein
MSEPIRMDSMTDSAADMGRDGDSLEGWHLVIEEARQVTTDTSISPGNYITETIQPGTYPIKFTNISGSEWTPEGITPGYIANIGPYYAEIRMDTTQQNQRSVNRIGAHSRAKFADLEGRPGTLTARPYAYEVRPGAEFYGGTVTRTQEA